MNNYELHMKTHTCYDDCQNPVCVAVREATAAKPPTHSEQWWRHEVSNAWAEGYEKGRLQRKWQGLTEGETIDLALSAFALPEVSSETREKIHRDLVIAMNDQDSRLMIFAANIEAKLKEKNGTI